MMDQPDGLRNSTQSVDLEEDRLHEECGVFGIYGHPDAAAITALGLHALQHRGQEAAGIVSFDGKRFHSERRMGLVGDNFSRREVIERLPGNTAIGHNRYSTTGETILRNVQPLFCELDGGGFAAAHNGNLTNGLTLRKQLVRDGAIMQSTSDSEVILHLVARSQRNRFIDRFIDGLRQLEGAYSFVALTNKKLIGARDPLGIRPLVIGDLGGHPILASETCALGIIRNHYVGRTFIEPTQQIRQLGVRLKHSANRAVVNGKRIVLVDDSIVRGTTSTKIVQMMRDAGATEVHFRIASPPITHPDYYGIDTPEQDKLLAATHTIEQMRALIGADSLAFLSVEGIYRSMGYEQRDPERPQFTDHCFTGDYPTPLTDHTGQEASPRQLSLLAEAR